MHWIISFNTVGENKAEHGRNLEPSASCWHSLCVEDEASKTCILTDSCHSPRLVMNM